ncbi:verprolin-like [Iris pallida]|uniref:Verprolin-like n=1 Tax=Iris pallida TaxID=29817 RepID=A0AAX6HYN3_IRIPA|nr:verprolin-like [Iris pallida]
MGRCISRLLPENRRYTHTATSNPPLTSSAARASNLSPSTATATKSPVSLRILLPLPLFAVKPRDPEPGLTAQPLPDRPARLLAREPLAAPPRSPTFSVVPYGALRVPSAFGLQRRDLLHWPEQDPDLSSMNPSSSLPQQRAGVRRCQTR